MRQNLIDFDAALVLAILSGFDYRVLTKTVDVAVAHIGDGGLTVGVHLSLHLLNAVLYRMDFVFRQLQGLEYQIVLLQDFGGCKDGRNTRPFRVVLKHVGQGVYRTVNWSGAEILTFGKLLSFCSTDGHIDELGNSLIFAGRNRNHRDTQILRHLMDFNRAPIGTDLIHHIECQHHWDIELNQLHSEIQVSLLYWWHPEY